MISIIVAYDPNRVIGKDGKLPWDLPEDRKWFKEVTGTSPVIMGRKTWESLPNKYRPLPNRTNIILSSNRSFAHDTMNFPNILVFDRPIDSINFVNNHIKKDIFVIGGEKVYRIFLDNLYVDEVLATEIKQNYEGDTYFPELTGNWEKNILDETESFNIVQYIRNR